MIFSTSTFVALLGLITSAAAAQTSPAVVCVAGQCVQGYSNVTIGATLSASGSSTKLHLLPGQYSSTTSPQLLHDLLTSSSASLSSSAGFSSGPSISSLPLNLALQPGLAIYSQAFYAGQDAFSSLPTTPVNNNVTLPMAAKSLALSGNVWVSVASSANSGRTVLWDSVPDLSQISLSSSLTLLDMQSTTCSPICSGAGVCSSSGQCICPSNFGGPSCETCATGFFGPQCQPCPAGCDKCDDGISGSGVCLTQQIGPTDPRQCNCVNGVCGANGSCACNDGWTNKSDGTQCSTCAPGFFLTSTGDCSACQLGCTQCADTTGTCSSCSTGYTINANDPTKCNPIQPVLSTGVVCPSNTFGGGTQCQACSSQCLSCTGSGASSCLTCAEGLFMFNGQCVQADANGVCAGSNGLVGDNVKNICQTCPSKCTSCGIPNFTSASTINQLQCTKCLPGFFLSNGNCVQTCPPGTFVNPQDNLTCIACSASCGTCSGSSNFCLTCPGNLLASEGKCVSTCPSGTFTSTSQTTPPTSACLACHPDCLTCSGSSFNQCTSCAASRPVLSTLTGASAGRCLSTCNKSQYFDATANACQSCDGSCASCSGPSPSQCLSCSSGLQVVKGGKCVDANCASGTGVIPGLGVCLSDLVQIPTTTSGAAPLPTITGLGDPTVVVKKGKLQWWQILLMALGCAFIFVAFLWCCRRRARKQRAKKTVMFAKGKGIDKSNWGWGGFAARWRMLFRRNNKKAKAPVDVEGELPIAYNHHEVTSRPVSVARGLDIKLSIMNAASSGSPRDTKADASSSRKTRDAVDSYIDAYDYPRRSLSIHSRTPSALPDLDGYYPPRNRNYDYDRDRLRRAVTQSHRGQQRDLEQESIYSEMTGVTRHTPEPRIPVKRSAAPIGYDSRRGSVSSSGSDSPVRNAGKLRKAMDRNRSDDSVVIQPRLQETSLIDLAESVPNRQAPLQFQYPPFLSSQPVQIPPPTTGLTPAQTYALDTRPELIGGGIRSFKTATATLPSGVGLGITNPSALGNLGATGGLYWLEPTDGSNSDFVLKPALTGSSTLTSQTQVSSNNPFRAQRTQPPF